ncbi:MAG TPA: hypothetical protein PKC31_01770 [Candidatus Nanoperiomorbaceae bacterium]|nr:hypothetical protein [Candidatus Nanoperiomorbaceae bacterium]HMQ96571.1 hypothetical protein [Candidatus Nanoperiomorbaceae bacterium]HMR86171.1 hypothetical protein [Candidatus Nanoperiomorbaceae bacterium]HMU11853.1 hypothetical protein [Candidatus Nanoperiomorbaceae bacterium]
MRQVDFVIDSETDYIAQFITQYVGSFDFPAMVNDVFHLKTEFHVSLLKLPAETDDDTRSAINKASIAAGKVFTARPFRFTGQFRTCRYQDRQSIIGLVSTPALAEWRKAIAAVAPDLEFTIPHVTLYTLDGRGIGLNSEAEFAERTTELDEATHRLLINILQAKENN